MKCSKCSIPYLTWRSALPVPVHDIVKVEFVTILI